MCGPQADSGGIIDCSFWLWFWSHGGKVEKIELDCERGITRERTSAADFFFKQNLDALGGRGGSSDGNVVCLGGTRFCSDVETSHGVD